MGIPVTTVPAFVARARVHVCVYTFALKYSRDQYSVLVAIYDFSIASRDFSLEFRQDH